MWARCILIAGVSLAKAWLLSPTKKAEDIAAGAMPNDVGAPRAQEVTLKNASLRQKGGLDFAKARFITSLY